MSIESPILSTFLSTEIELNRWVIRVLIRFYSAPTGIETLIYHLMDLFISYLTPYNHVQQKLAFSKFSALSYVKETLADADLGRVKSRNADDWKQSLVTGCLATWLCGYVAMWLCG